jgi:hypothetical protein
MNFKKILVLAVMVAASVVFGQTPWNGTVDTSWYDTRQTTFTITTAEQLAGLAELVNRENNPRSFSGTTIFLGADIDLGGRNWTPIGHRILSNYFSSHRPFRGTFDGDGYSISNLSINSVSIDGVVDVYLGLFGYASGRIRNLTLEVKEIAVHLSVVSENNVYIMVGGLAGRFSSSNIENVAVNIIDSISITREITRGDTYIGGLVGYAEGSSIVNSSVLGKVSGEGRTWWQTQIGGLAGSANRTSSIINSHFNGNIYAHFSILNNYISIGGLVGSAAVLRDFGTSTRLTISNSYSIANVVLTGITSNSGLGIGWSPIVRYGGLIGSAPYDFTITNSYASGTISRTITGNMVAIGGIIGIASFSRSRQELSSVYYNSTMTSMAIGFDNWGLYSSLTPPTPIDTSGITALTSAQMRNRANFVGWDFHNVWSNLEGVTFPFLQGRTEKIVISLTANVASKIFDGNTAAQASNAQLIGTRQGSDIRIKEITANFSDRNPGINIPVFFDVVLEGNDAEWYEFVSSPLITATILPIPITVTLDPKTVNVNQNARIMPNIEKNLAFIGDIYNVPETEEASPVAEWSSFTVALPWFDDWAFRNSRFLVYDTIVIPETEFRIAVLNGYRRTQFSTDVIRDDELIEGTYAITFVPNRSTRYNITFDNQDLYFVVTDDGTFIRPRSQIDSRFGILSENAVVSDVARFSVITPEPAVANVRILDNLGNVVFSADDVGANHHSPNMHGDFSQHSSGDIWAKNVSPLQNAIVWNLTNPNGRLVANGTYIIAVEATAISGKRYHYSTRIGVKR